jgi:endonuclease-3
LVNVKQILTALGKAYPLAKTELQFNSPYELLVATILSAQTTDRQVNKTTPKLFSYYPTPEALATANCEHVAQLIKGVGLYRTKARYLVATAKILTESFQGQVPHTLAELLTLPGVGRKTAKVVLANAFGIPALAVDTHVFRVTRRLGLASGNTPEQVEKELENSIPPEEWIVTHHRLIRHGRQVCRARRPLCNECCLRSYCPSAKN